MQLDELTLLNFCQHRDRHFRFNPGLTAVIGRNGSGKSNFMGGIRLALTGENPNAGAKLDNISQLAPVTEKSFVRLGFSHAGTKAVVTRNLRPNKPTATLEIEGQKTISGDNEVTSRIMEILGVRSDIMNDIVLVAQSDIFGFLSKTPGKRAEQFQKLFHLEKALVVHGFLGDQSSKLTIPTVGVNADSLLAQRVQYQNQITAQQSQLSTLPTHVEMQGHRDSNTQVSRDFAARAAAERQYQTLTEQFNELNRTRTTVEVAKTGFANDLATLQQYANGNKAAADEANVILGNLQQYKQVSQMRTNLYERVNQTQTQLSALQEPQLPTGYLPQEQIRTSIDQLNRLLAVEQGFVQQASGLSQQCPTCRQPVTPELISQQVTEAKTRVADYEQQLATATRQFGEARTYDAALASVAAQRLMLNTGLTQLNNQLQQMPQLTAVEADENTLRDTISQQNKYVGEITQQQQLVQNHERELARIDGQLQQMTTQLTNLKAQVDKLPLYTAEQNQEAIKNAQGWDEWIVKRSTFERELALAEQQVRSIDQQLLQLESVQREATILQDWMALSNAMRAVVHKDAAPKFVSQRNLERLQFGINELLEMFGAEYRVVADEGLSFMGTFMDGRRQPAERLSEGQKVILALTFRFALNFAFAAGLNGIYLDEPTAFLDEDTIRGFQPVLERLHTFVASRGLQCFIVTHERELAPLFDSVIQL